MATAGDPFYVVQAEVEQSMSSIEDTVQRIEDGRNTAKEDVTASMTQQLEASIGGVEWDLQDLEETVRVVETNRGRFKLSEEDVQVRRQFIERTRAALDAFRSRLSRPATTSRRPRQQLIDGRSDKPVSFGDAPREERSNADDDNDAFIRNEMMYQDRIVQEQDEGLDVLSTVVRRIGVMGTEMHQELSEQAEMIDDLEAGTQDATTRLRLMQRRLDKIIEETGRGKICFIIVLFIVFLVLCALAVLL